MGSGKSKKKDVAPAADTPSSSPASDPNTSATAKGPASAAAKPEEKKPDPAAEAKAKGATRARSGSVSLGKTFMLKEYLDNGDYLRKWENVELMDQVDDTGDAEVWKAKLKDDKEIVALKKLKPGFLSKASDASIYICISCVCVWVACVSCSSGAGCVCCVICA